MTFANDVRLTYFASPERTAPEVLERQHHFMRDNPLVKALLQSFPEPAAIINGQRQIVLANDKLAHFARTAVESLIGLRMGEAIGCEYSHEPPAGCGTTRACELCGAAHAIARTQSARQPASEDCRIVLTPERGHDSLDFGVWTTPVDVEGEPFTVFAIRDTSDEHRRRVLERMFFHDILNSAGGLRNLLELLPELPREKAADLTQSAAHLARQVVEEIRAQRDLASAERGELTARVEKVDIAQLLEDVVLLYRHHSVAEGKVLSLEVGLGPNRVETDPTLLRRVIGNLVKNALEASRPGQTVTLRYGNEGRPVFEVHNVSVMSEAVKLQVFRRSFSTKGGTGRGIGAYSARLLTERYLHGKLGFASEDGQGTTFVVTLP